MSEDRSMTIAGHDSLVKQQRCAGRNVPHPAGCAPPTLSTAVPGKTYRLHVDSLTSLSALNFAIDDHSMTVVEAGGHYVRPIVVDSFYIYSGESYDKDFV
ncbi:hypothetical protein BDA96_03G016200 [Sorghum bicolor]|nr:hypothetical protein BDA96_03G016200 [Sorghum bicolor]